MAMNGDGDTFFCTDMPGSVQRRYMQDKRVQLCLVTIVLGNVVLVYACVYVCVRVCVCECVSCFVKLMRP
jgi:hypothetical protein